MKIVIRAGGSGTRLWPLSRRQSPKQFLPLLGKRSLLEEKINEIRPAVNGWNDIYISVTEPFIATVKKLVPKVPKKNIIAEPIGRNTGPAIGLESVIIQAATGSIDPVIASLTVDDVFTNVSGFRSALKAAERYIEKQPFRIVTLASNLKVPDTGLSYIELGKALGKFGRQTIFNTHRWIEKPKLFRIKKLLKQNNVFAHTGLYIWKTSTILSLFEKHQPTIYNKLLKIQLSYDHKNYSQTIGRLYRTMPAISIEKAIIGKEKNIAVCAGSYGWSDTGKWYLVKNILKPGNKNITTNNVILKNVSDSLVYGDTKRMTGVVGLSGVVIVDTGDALLICSKEYSGDVKKIVEELEQRKQYKYL
ncbi:mannose-1-phosphate guanylyltransferase [Patescibacteria group bacterium]